MLFKLGQIVATPGALEALEQSMENPADFLHRHQTGDWGKVTDEDDAENWYSVEHGFRVFSVYELNTGLKIWVITEADRSATTILLPTEY